MLLILSRRGGQTAIKALRFCIKISSFKTSMLQFLKKTKFSHLPLEFCKSIQRLWSRSKKQFSRSMPSTSCRDGLLTKVFGDVPYNCHRTTADRSSTMAAEDHWSGQVSPVKFSCTQKLLMKLEVNQCYHAFQEDFVIWFPNQFLAW